MAVWKDRSRAFLFSCLTCQPVCQRNTRLSGTEYHYKNVPNDSGTPIQVDEFGLVVYSPVRFVRTGLADWMTTNTNPPRLGGLTNGFFCS
ncbi:hypothetical protein GCM10027347_47340 [Larkinella harenae]